MSIAVGPKMTPLSLKTYRNQTGLTLTGDVGVQPVLRGPCARAWKRLIRWGRAGWVTCVVLLPLAGCVTGPRLLAPEQQKSIDRRLVETPAGFELKPVAENLTAPSAIAFDTEGNLLIAESGACGREPRIFGWRVNGDGKFFQIYPTGARFSLPFTSVKTGFRIYGPVGGMVVDHGKVYVSHRDAESRGVITAFEFDGSHSTVVADLPAQGDYSVTDLALGPNGRLYFGMGAATNSGVVGRDNWDAGWVKRFRKVHDIPYIDLKLNGYRFDAKNPLAGLFEDEIAVTAPFQPFGKSNETWVRKSPTGKPNAAVYSVSPTGGDLRVEAFGIRRPSGLMFNEFGTLYFTNQGMEMRGTRPVKDDPDALLRLVPGASYGWPDYSADLRSISESIFQPPIEAIIRSGYREVSAVIDQTASGTSKPNRDVLLKGVFQPLSGASKLDFVPGAGAFSDYRGNAIVALWGDRAPFATTGMKLIGPTGYKVVRVDVDTGAVSDFLRNTRAVPASRLEGDDEGTLALERPIDVKFGPDGAMYILDFGELSMRGGRERVPNQTGRVFKLVAIPEAPTTQE